MRSERPPCRCRGVTLALYYLICSNRFFNSVKARSRVNQEARQRCDGIAQVAPPGS
jgi:hypothetical protein